MKHKADKGRSERSFSISEKGFVKLQPYAQSSVVNRPYPKLAYKYFGPFVILEKFGAVAYRLELPAKSFVHPVFHVSQHKEHVPDHTPVFSSLPNPLLLDATEVVPELIFDRRLVKWGNTAYTQVLAKWISLPETMVT